MNEKKPYYPSFLLQFKGRAFDPVALHDAYTNARIGGKVRGESDEAEFFRYFKIDEAHWHLHQKILFNDVLFRLISEGFLHPTVHPVAGIIHDREFYGFVFPFVHTAILRKMADAIHRGNNESVKLIMMWIEPFGDYFVQSFYRFIEFRADEILRELNNLQLNRKLLPFDLYSSISPALMHMLNRLPLDYQPLRDRFASGCIAFAAWLRNDMKVYTQPTGILTRLKLLNTDNAIHAQLRLQMKQWEDEKEKAGKEKFNLNHLIWIIPLFFIVAFFAWRQTEWGKSYEDIQAERDMNNLAAQEKSDEKWDKINKRMNNIDLNQLLVEELFVFHRDHPGTGKPKPPDGDPNRLDTGDEPYKMWLSPGRKADPMFDLTLDIVNGSKCDVIVFLRQTKAPYVERAYYLRSGRSMSVYDSGNRSYLSRIYAGSYWQDSLVYAGYDQKLLKAGVPEEAKDQFPSTTELRGHFLYPAKSIEENLQPVDPDTVQYNSGGFSSPQMAPSLISIYGDWDGIKYGQQ